MTRSDYEIVSISDDRITIDDLNRGRMSVTNDAENVVKELIEHGKLHPGMRLFYFDSDGALSEITFDANGFTGFKPGPQP